MSKQNTFTIYRLKVSLSTSKGKPSSIWRIIEISSDNTLKQLHRLIFKAFDREDDDEWSFYFGKPHRKGTVEYVSPVDKNELALTGAKLGSRVKLNAVPFSSTKEIRYLFDFCEECWHRIEFLGEFESVSGVRYPMIFQKHGESPPQYSDFEEKYDEDFGVQITTDLDRRVTYAELDEVLRSHKGALPASEAVGFIYGMISAPFPMMPSEFLQILLGDEPFRSKGDLERVVSAIVSLNNEIAGLAMQGKPVVFRPDYPQTNKGIACQARDLMSEIQGFVRGMAFGAGDLKTAKKVMKNIFKDFDKTLNLLDGIKIYGEGKLAGEGEIDNNLLKTTLEDMADAFTQFCFQTNKDLRSMHEGWVKNLEK